ncbi:MAG: mechanosensitive ion channel family protein [Bacillota bacterium]
MSFESLWQQLVEYVNPTAVMATGIEIILILLAFHIAIRLGCAALDRVVHMTQSRLIAEEHCVRLVTLKGLLKSTFRYTMDFVALLTVLPKMRIETTQFLAGAGVVGLAVGFGAQSLVKDVISGFFLLLEDQLAVGDYVEISDISGVVEEMGLRVTKVRDYGGQLHFLPNGVIQTVTNHSRGPMRVLVHVDIAYEEDVDRAIAVLEDLCESMTDLMDVLEEGPQVLGLASLNDSSMTLTIRAQAKNMEQWRVEREIRRRIKRRFDEVGIEIPYPRRVVVPATLTKIVEEELA